MFRFRLEDQGSLSENLEVSQGKGLLKEEETARAEVLSQLPSGGQDIGASALTSVLPMNIQD